MLTTDGTAEFYEMAAKVLIRCFFMGMVILLFWGGLILFAGDLVATLHSNFSPMSSQNFYAINYAGMVFTKVSVFLLFLLPYIAIKLVTGR